MKRITIDLDTKSKLKLSYALTKAIFKINKIKEINVLRSHSGNYHIIIWTTTPYTLKEQYELREFIGDDIHRIELDKKRKVGKNTLFYKKIYVKNINKFK